MNVLGMDPGFASLGWAVLSLDGDAVQLVAMGIIRTKKDTRKQSVLASDDNLVRAREISRALQALCDKHRIAVICSESMSYPRNAAAAAKVAITWGVLAAISEMRKLPVVQASPQQVKKRTAGSVTASKLEISAHVKKVFGKSEVESFLSGAPATQHEHALDAAAVVLACLDSEVLRMARG